MKYVLLTLVGAIVVIIAVSSLESHSTLNNDLNAGTLGIKEEIGKPVTMILGGDVMLGRTVMSKSLEMGDFVYPFREVGGELSSADVTFVNLENPVIDNCPPHAEGYIFCSNKEMLEGLVYSGVDVVSIANNHTRNYGEEGINQTMKNLSNYGIKYTGQGSFEIVNVKDFDIGFLAFDFTALEPDKKDYQLIKDSYPKVDFLVVSVHWGVEYTSEPTMYQREWAREMVENGADLIVGHHPHWVQSNEVIEGRKVYYSLGNLVFDQMWSEETKKGVLIKLSIDNLGKIVGEEKIDTYMQNWAQPDFSDGNVF